MAEFVKHFEQLWVNKHVVKLEVSKIRAKKLFRDTLKQQVNYSEIVI